MCHARKPSGRCYVCEYKRRKKDLYKWSFSVHRNNAKRRGIPWQLTFEEFKKFAVEEDLVYMSGRTKQSLSIDRVISSEGYHKDNIQILTVSENSKKSQGEDKKFRRTTTTEYENPPF